MCVEELTVARSSRVLSGLRGGVSRRPQEGRRRGNQWEIVRVWRALTAKLRVTCCLLAQCWTTAAVEYREQGPDPGQLAGYPFPDKDLGGWAALSLHFKCQVFGWTKRAQRFLLLTETTWWTRETLTQMAQGNMRVIPDPPREINKMQSCFPLSMMPLPRRRPGF